MVQTTIIGNELLKSTHLLIGGTTGCGKSVLLNNILLSLLTKKTPASAALVLIDPKRVELSKYKKLPFTKRYAQEPNEVIFALKDTIRIMEKRYKQMERQGIVKWQGGAVYVIIDELADLMITDGKNEIRRLLQRLLQLGRAANIHIIAATQAPSRKVIPAELVLNFTDRIALQCKSPIESRQIIGVRGAESLPRHGVGLYDGEDGLRRVEIPLTPQKALNNRIEYWAASV